jgi:CubicO group peptidase (beta-lactamase class C family)
MFCSLGSLICHSFDAEYNLESIPLDLPIEYDENSRHILYSCTKSVTSALIGIAIEEGYIGGVDDKILDYFDEDDIQINDSRKQNITIANLLTMSAGFEWNESISYYDPANSFRQLITSDNWVQFVLDRPMVSNPGLIFNYNSGISHLLSAIIQKTTGKTTLEFANEHLFGPLGITNIFWDTDPQGINFGGSELYLTPRDMAKFGYLYLNNGSWDGIQIISHQWVNASISHQIIVSEYNDYGYQWWMPKNGSQYLAVGWSAQRIYVMPDYNIVLVFTANV